MLLLLYLASPPKEKKYLRLLDFNLATEKGKPSCLVLNLGFCYLPPYRKDYSSDRPSEIRSFHLENISDQQLFVTAESNL